MAETKKVQIAVDKHPLKTFSSRFDVIDVKINFAERFLGLRFRKIGDRGKSQYVKSARRAMGGQFFRSRVHFPEFRAGFFHEFSAQKINSAVTLAR